MMVWDVQGMRAYSELVKFMAQGLEFVVQEHKHQMLKVSNSRPGT